VLHGQSFADVAHLVFSRDVWIRTQRAAARRVGLQPGDPAKSRVKPWFNSEKNRVNTW
jgi:hypothetical protein